MDEMAHRKREFVVNRVEIELKRTRKCQVYAFLLESMSKTRQGEVITKSGKNDCDWLLSDERARDRVRIKCFVCL